MVSEQLEAFAKPRFSFLVVLHRHGLFLGFDRRFEIIGLSVRSRQRIEYARSLMFGQFGRFGCIFNCQTGHFDSFRRDRRLQGLNGILSRRYVVLIDPTLPIGCHTQKVILQILDGQLFPAEIA